MIEAQSSFGNYYIPVLIAGMLTEYVPKIFDISSIFTMQLSNYLNKRSLSLSFCQIGPTA
jgi:hypothetical protein